MLLKQDDQAPFSLQLDGDYSFSFIESDYFEDLDQQKEGHGYVINLRLLRDFSPGERWILRFGFFGSFKSYRYTVSQIGFASEEDQEYQVERETEIFYGGNLTIGKKTARGRTWYIAGEPVLDDDFNVSVSVRTGVVLEM